MDETKVSIEGYEGNYEITPTGRIFSVHRNEFRHRNGDQYGFKWVKLSRPGERKNFLAFEIWKKTFPTLALSEYQGMK